MLILISYIAFWIFLYFLEEFHDAFITLETNVHPPTKNYVKANYYKGMWHKYDTYSYAIFHIGFALLFAFLTFDSRLTTNDSLFSFPFFLLTFSFLLVSASVKRKDRSWFTVKACPEHFREKQKCHLKRGT